MTNRLGGGTEFLLRRRYILMKKKDEEKMKEWIELEKITISEPQKLKKEYDSAYENFMCEICIPRGSKTLSGQYTLIFGNYGLYYKSITVIDTYDWTAVLSSEKISDKTYLMKCAYGSNTGISDFKNQTAKIFEITGQISYLTIDFELPAGTEIRIWAK